MYYRDSLEKGRPGYNISSRTTTPSVLPYVWIFSADPIVT